jgi:AcrR family transcriptional regulator
VQTKKDEVRTRILKDAKRLFLKKGFKKTSIRAIAEEAEITSGTLYVYFRDKNEIFETIVSPATNQLFSQMKNTMGGFHGGLDDIPETFSRAAGEAAIKRLLDMIYNYHDEFKLLLHCAGGSELEDFPTRLYDAYSQHGMSLLTAIAEKQGRSRTFSPTSVRIVLSIFIKIVDEILASDMPREEADKCTAQWAGIIFGAWSGLIQY